MTIRMASLPETTRSFFAYVISGGTGVAVYAAILATLLRLRVTAVAAFTLSYIVAVTVQFLLNRYWSFRARSGALLRQLAMYTLVLFINYALMIGTEELAMHSLHFSPMAAFLASVPLNTAVGFAANKYLTFRLGQRTGLAPNGRK